LTALELDLDRPGLQPVDQIEHGGECPIAPVEPFRLDGCSGDLAIAAGKVAAKCRNQDQVIERSRRASPAGARKAPGERCEFARGSETGAGEQSTGPSASISGLDTMGEFFVGEQKAPTIVGE